MARLRTLHVYSLVLLGALFLVCSSSALAQRRYEISDFNVEIVITPDSNTDVTENITFHFIGSSWHGVYRDIPIQYEGPGRLNYSYFLNIKSIEEDGRALKFESSTQRQFRHLKIYVPNADNSSHTVSIRYVISNALRFFPDHDEFYWNITGNYWEVPILHASAHIVFPENVKNLRTKVFTGALGSRAHDATVNVVGSGVDVRTEAALAPREGLTIAIACDKGVLHEPTKLQLFFLYLRSNWPLIIPVLVFPLMLWWWWTRGRDPAAPWSISPSTCATLPPPSSIWPSVVIWSSKSATSPISSVSPIPRSTSFISRNRSRTGPPSNPTSSNCSAAFSIRGLSKRRSRSLP